MAWCYKLTESDGVRYKYSKICQHGFQMWRITDQPLISCNCGLLLHLFSGMSTNNANFCHNNSSQLKCKKSRIKSSLVRKTATKKEANTLIEALWSWPWPGRLHTCVLWIVSTWLFYSLTLRSLATVYVDPSLRQLSYCGTGQKKTGKRIQICWLHNDVADTHITPPCRHS